MLSVPHLPSPTGDPELAGVDLDGAPETKDIIAKRQPIYTVDPVTKQPRERKKPGRKPSATPATSRRQELNRAAQKTYKERKERYVHGLENKTLLLESMIKTKDGEIATLRDLLTSLMKENQQLKEGTYIPSQQSLDLLDAVTSVLNTPSSSSSLAQAPLFDDLASLTVPSQILIPPQTPLSATPTTTSNMSIPIINVTSTSSPLPSPQRYSRGSPVTSDIPDDISSVYEMQECHRGMAHDERGNADPDHLFITGVTSPLLAPLDSLAGDLDSISLLSDEAGYSSDHSRRPSFDAETESSLSPQMVSFNQNIQQDLQQQHDSNNQPPAMLGGQVPELDYSYRDPAVMATMTSEQIKAAWLATHQSIIGTYNQFDSFAQADWSNPTDLHFGQFMDLDFNEFDPTLLEGVDVEQIACYVLRNKLRAILAAAQLERQAGGGDASAVAADQEQRLSQDVERWCGLLSNQGTCQEALNVLEATIASSSQV